MTVLVIDIDGTLVDTNYHHALSWSRAFRRYGMDVPLWVLHRHIGMGGDQLVASVTDDDVEERLGDELRAASAEEYAPLLAESRPLPGATEFLRAAKDDGLDVVLASSGRPDDVEHHVDLLEAREIVSAWTTSEDVERTKPQPDLISVAWEKAGGGPAVVIGDSTWDFVAAGRAGLAGAAVLSGGFGADELRSAGARLVARDVGELSGRWPELRRLAATSDPARP